MKKGLPSLWGFCGGLAKWAYSLGERAGPGKQATG